MTTRAFVFTAVLLAATAAPGRAQTPAATQPATAPRARGSVPAPPAEPRLAIPPPAEPRTATTTPGERPRREGQPVNVRVDLTLTDQRGGVAPITRTVTVLAADGYTGSIRSSSQVVAVGVVPLNVDATPTLLSDGKVRVAINLQYDWPAPTDNDSSRARGTVTTTSLHDQLAMILESGKPMVVAQSADPVGDRQVTVEVKATVLR
jgi:hypothetical protein